MHSRTLAGLNLRMRRGVVATLALLVVVPTAASAAIDRGDRLATSEIASANAEVLVSPTQIVATRAALRSELADLYTEIITLNQRLDTLDTTATPAAWTSGRQSAVRAPLVDALQSVESAYSELDAELSALEANFADESPWAEFGLSFAVFPVDDVDEFVNSWGNRRSGGRRHKGTDILAPMGTALFALEDGVVERTSNSHLGGLSVYLLGDSGARYYYAHLSALGEFAEGQRISAGQIIGYNGDSGNARGTPHLHFQVAPNGGNDWQNPYPLLIALWEYERNADGPPVRVWN